MKLRLILVGFETKILLSVGKNRQYTLELIYKLKKDFINREFQYLHSEIYIWV